MILGCGTVLPKGPESSAPLGKQDDTPDLTSTKVQAIANSQFP